MVVDQAAEIAELDGPRAEAWASDVLALVAEAVPGDDGVDALLGGLDAETGSGVRGASAAIRRLAGCDPISPGDDDPAWAASLGTSRCEDAWLLVAGGSTSAALRFVDSADVRHVLTVDLVGGSPETIGEVAVGPGELLDALGEEDADIETEEASPATVAARVAAALSVTDVATESLVVNGRLLLLRLSTLVDVDVAPPVFVVDDVPDVPERDPEDDAFAVEVLGRALGTPPPVDAVAASADPIDDDVSRWLAASGCDDTVPIPVALVVGAVAPVDLAPLISAERDAVLALEWADWLGAVIGVVRAGAGTAVDGAALVDHINRCPEVTSTIPKADRDRIAWAFDTVIAGWPAADLLAVAPDGGATLTPLALTAIPAALHAAWS